jgi:hypothetical protein
MITRDLAVGDLDAKWTPERRRGRYGLHADSTIWPLARAVATNLRGSLEEATPEVFPIRMLPRSRLQPISAWPPNQLILT